MLAKKQVYPASGAELLPTGRQRTIQLGPASWICPCLFCWDGSLRLKGYFPPSFLIWSSAIRQFLCVLPSHTTPAAPLPFFTTYLISCQRTGTAARGLKLLPEKLQGVRKLGPPVGSNFKPGCDFQDQQLFCFNSFYRLVCSALAWINWAHCIPSTDSCPELSPAIPAWLQ